MGACVTRCLPLYSDPRYQPVRSRYLIQDDVVQAEPSRATRLSASSDESLCLNDILGSADYPFPADEDEDDPSLPAEPTEPADSDRDPPLLVLTPGLTQSLVVFVPLGPPATVSSPRGTSVSNSLSASVSPSVSTSPSTHVSTSVVSMPQQYQHLYSITGSTSDLQAEDEVELTQRVEQPDEESSHHPAPRITPARGGLGYGGAGGGGGGVEGNNIGNSIVGGYTGGFTGEQQHRWWGSTLPGSLPSLAEVDSPPTTSLDLEWEPEAGLGRVSRESLGTGEEEASQTAESSSWVPRSACSTPNSLEWDFRASTLSLRGQGEEEEAWQMTSDQETEQLLYEIEQLAARALADTGHGLQPNR